MGTRVGRTAGGARVQDRHLSEDLSRPQYRERLFSPRDAARDAHAAAGHDVERVAFVPLGKDQRLRGVAAFLGKGGEEEPVRLRETAGTQGAGFLLG